MRKWILVFSITTMLSNLAMAAIPEGCIDEGNGTCVYREKNVTSHYDTSNGYMLSKTVMGADEIGVGLGVVTNTYRYSYDDNGNITDIAYTSYTQNSNRVDETIVHYNYDNDNNLLSATRKSDNYINGSWKRGLELWTSPVDGDGVTYGTDENGNRTKTLYVKFSSSDFTYTYNEDGILIAGSRLESGSGFTYDDNGALLSYANGSNITSVTYDDNGGYSGSIKSYNEDGSLRNERIYNLSVDPNYELSDGRIGTLRTLMENGTRERLTVYNEDGSILMGTGQRVYDGHGNITNDYFNIIPEGGISTTIKNMRYSYTYDDNGNILTCIETDQLSGQIITKNYNKNGGYSIVNADGSISNYNADGTLLIPKRIYTVEEASKLSKPTGNTFKLRYK
ncbi:MAG: hypothetical protein IJ870_03790 [Alphaproteobacteria bacterium]|nr:hypothetical protein [Alphaproteobacteria bacterium]